MIATAERAPPETGVQRAVTAALSPRRGAEAWQRVSRHLEPSAVGAGRL